MRKDTISRFLTVPLISDGTNTGFKTVLNPDYVDPCPSSPSYTLKEIEALAWEYCNDATSAARLEDRLRLSLFVQWLVKREREGLEC